jgi:hypothetical protein
MEKRPGNYFALLTKLEIRPDNSFVALTKLEIQPDNYFAALTKLEIGVQSALFEVFRKEPVKGE